jgi:hypothetical protein
VASGYQRKPRNGCKALYRIQTKKAKRGRSRGPSRLPIFPQTAKGATVETIFYPAEGHGFLKIENRIDAMRRTIAWFDTYLKGEKATARK